MLLLPKFEFHEPKTLKEALSILSTLGAKAKVIAGGTDLMVNMKKKVVSPQNLISLSCIKELNEVKETKSEIRIGACFTVADLITSSIIKKKLPALSSAADNLGSPLVRNLATIGGNVCSARPAADLPPALMVYNAKIIIKGKKGERSLSLEEFFKGPGKTALKPDELVTEFRIKIPKALSGAGYNNIGIRKGHDCNLVNVASSISIDEKGIIKSAQVAMGCVGPTHLRALSAEKVLYGQKATDALFEKAAEAAMKDSTPITDFRASGDYKKAMVGVLTRRTLEIAFKDAKKRK